MFFCFLDVNSIRPIAPHLGFFSAFSSKNMKNINDQVPPGWVYYTNSFRGERKCLRQVYRKNLLKCHHTVDCKHHLTLEEVDPWQYLDRFTTGGYLPRKQQACASEENECFLGNSKQFQKDSAAN